MYRCVRALSESVPEVNTHGVLATWHKRKITMKKRPQLILLVILLALTCLAGCGASEGSTVDELIAQQEQEAKHDSQFYSDTQMAEEEEPAGDPGAITSYDPEDIDLDLTTMSATMVYSEVNSMMVSPEDYVGLIIKMGGTEASYFDENTKKTYYACVIADATACCTQGIEYELMDGYGKNAYPADDSYVTVVGEFITYEELDRSYVRLKNAELIQ